MFDSKIFDLDFRKKDDRQELTRLLLDIKPLAKYLGDKKVPLDALEKLLHLVCFRYKVYVGNILVDNLSNDERDILSMSIVDESTLNTIAIVNGLCMQELYSKSVLYLWYLVESKSIEKRSNK